MIAVSDEIATSLLASIQADNSYLKNLSANQSVLIVEATQKPLKLVTESLATAKWLFRVTSDSVQVLERLLDCLSAQSPVRDCNGSHSWTAPARTSASRRCVRLVPS